MDGRGLGEWISVAPSGLVWWGRGNPGRRCALPWAVLLRPVGAGVWDPVGSVGLRARLHGVNRGAACFQPPVAVPCVDLG